MPMTAAQRIGVQLGIGKKNVARICLNFEFLDGVAKLLQVLLRNVFDRRRR